MGNKERKGPYDDFSGTVTGLLSDHEKATKPAEPPTPPKTKRRRQWDRDNPVAGLRLPGDLLDRIQELAQERDQSKSTVAEGLLKMALEAVDNEWVDLTFEVEKLERTSTYQWRGRTVKRFYHKAQAVARWKWRNVDASGRTGGDHD